MKQLALLLCAVVTLVACKDLPALRSGSVNSGSSPSGPKAETVGRFQLLQATAHLSTGKDLPITLRMDTATGETWVLGADGYRWIGVEDELRRAGTYNPKTDKIEWGVKAPDGRDLAELSKEELIRYLSAAIRNGQRPNPKDPLGLFEGEKQKP